MTAFLKIKYWFYKKLHFDLILINFMQWSFWLTDQFCSYYHIFNRKRVTTSPVGEELELLLICSNFVHLFHLDRVIIQSVRSIESSILHGFGAICVLIQIHPLIICFDQEG